MGVSEQIKYYAVKWISFDLSPDVYIKLLYEMRRAQLSHHGLDWMGVDTIVWFLSCVFRKCKCACDKWQWQFIGTHPTRGQVRMYCTLPQQSVWTWHEPSQQNQAQTYVHHASQRLWQIYRQQNKREWNSTWHFWFATQGIQIIQNVLMEKVNFLIVIMHEKRVKKRRHRDIREQDKN